MEVTQMKYYEDIFYRCYFWSNTCQIIRCISCLAKQNNMRLLAQKITHSLRCNLVKHSLKPDEKIHFPTIHNPYFDYRCFLFPFYLVLLFFLAAQYFPDLDFEIIVCLKMKFDRYGKKKSQWNLVYDKL